MANNYRLSPEAQKDFESIWLYIAQDNRTAADRLRAQFRDAFEKLAEHPYMGHKREDLTKRPLRFWPVSSYLIIYKQKSKPLEILRILSGFRDIAGLL